MVGGTEFHLVLSRRAYQRVVPRLLTGPGSCAFGPAQHNPHGAVTELLVRELELRDALPRGEDFPPWTDGAVLVAPTIGQTTDPRDWLQRIKPRPGQLLAVLLLGMGAARRRWDGAVADGDRMEALAGIRIPGTRMIQAARRADRPAARTPAEWTRWSRTRGALGDDVWQKVRAARVAVIGASRNGSLLAWMLAAVGVERLLLVDPDVVELHNLDATWGVTEAVVGSRKVEALAHGLTQFRADLAVQALACSAADARVVECVRGVDLVATCVDRDMPRLAAAVLAERFLKVHLDIGTGVTQNAAGERQIAGDVRLLLPGQGCVCCVGGLPDAEQARYELLAPPETLRRGVEIGWQQQRAGSLLTINAMCVAAGVQLWLDLLAGTLETSHWSRFRWRPGGGLESDAGSVVAAPACLLCHASRHR